MKRIAKTIPIAFAVVMTLILFAFSPRNVSASDTNAAKALDAKKNEFTVTIFDCATYQYVERTGIYEGEIKNGLPNGEGTFFLEGPSGNKYTVSGSFKAGVPDGKHVFKFDIPENEEAYYPTEMVISYTNGVVKNFYAKYERDREWQSYYGIKSGNGYFVMANYHTGFKETFHVDENGNVYTDNFDVLYYNNVLQPGAYGTEVDLSDGNVINTEKMRLASKSKLKKKAKAVSLETLENSSEKYEGKLIRLENVVMAGKVLYSSMDEDGNDTIYLERVTFQQGNRFVSLFADIDTVKFEFGKVVDLYFVSYGMSEFMVSEGFSDRGIVGWLVRKPTKSSKTNLTVNLYRYSDKKYTDVSGTFSGPIVDGKPNGFGTLSYKVNGNKVGLIGNFYADQPLEGAYYGFSSSLNEQMSALYKKGKLIESTVSLLSFDDETNEITQQWNMEIGHVTDNDVLSQVVIFNNEVTDVNHVDEKTGETFKNTSDIYMLTLASLKGITVDADTVSPDYVKMYFAIEDIKTHSKKEIKKMASETSVERMLGDISAFNEDVIKLENTEVLLVSADEYYGGQYFTEIMAKVEDTVFSMIIDGKKSYKEGDIITAYVTPSVIIEQEAGEEKIPVVMAYAYSVKKVK
ncbi:MAG: hypothetical protein K6F93_03860 [Lachnospiraceae bacterium]|nr:hypothetical protein [Lachnospiraceae bacterium]